MKLNPRERFKARPESRAHIDLVINEGFRSAVEAALNDYTIQLCQRAAAGDSAAFFQRLVGAEEFITILLNLAEPPPPKRFDKTQNLNHQV